jgi:nucleotide-binding universal stress UspA family protein
MKRFKNILYFADGVAQPCSAFRRAARLAERNRARLTVLDVIPNSHSQVEVLGRGAIEINRLMREDRDAQLGELIAPVREAGTDIRSRVVSGIAFVEVIRAVISQGYDIVVKAARPPDSFVKRALGSTDLHLLRKCPCPIWIDRADAGSPYRSILAAVDVADDAEEDSARLIIDLATSLAGREDARLAVVHAWGLEGEEVLRSARVGVSDEELEHLLGETRERRRDRFDSLLAPYGLRSDDGRAHLVKGEPASVIRELSAELEADLIVMGTLGRCGVPGVFIGDTAEDLLQTTPASVLAIKPYDFVSPVAAEDA